MVEYAGLLEKALLIVEKTRVFIADHAGKVTADQVEQKALNSLVSFVDKGAEQILVDGLQLLLPNSGFVTEEETVATQRKEYTWIIDPLDGTTNFLNNVPHYSISVALQHEGVTVLGIVQEVSSGELWTAIVDGGAFMNGHKISVTSKPMHDVLIATGFPYTNNYDSDRLFSVIREWLMQTRGMRRMGSAALDLAYVACGRFGAYYESSLNAWDLAAGALIVQEAGGIVTDFQGKDQFLKNGHIISCAPHIYEQVFANVNTHLGDIFE